MTSRWPALLLAGCGGTAAPVFPDPAEALFRRLDADGSGALGVDELAAPDPAATMASLDTDGDGVVSLSELRADAGRDLDPQTGRQVVGAAAVGGPPPAGEPPPGGPPPQRGGPGRR